MFTVNPKEKSKLDEAIDAAFAEIQAYGVGSTEHRAALDKLTELYKLKEIDSRPRVSPDTMAMVVANLAGILIIVGYERAHIMTSQAKNFLFKLK